VGNSGHEIGRPDANSSPVVDIRHESTLRRGQGPRHHYSGEILLPLNLPSPLDRVAPVGFEFGALARSLAFLRRGHHRGQRGGRRDVGGIGGKLCGSLYPKQRSGFNQGLRVR
jgi:hypothetical protein